MEWMEWNDNYYSSFQEVRTGRSNCSPVYSHGIRILSNHPRSGRENQLCKIDRYLIFDALLTLSSAHHAMPDQASQCSIMTAADHKTDLVIYTIRNKVIIIEIMQK